MAVTFFASERVSPSDSDLCELHELESLSVFSKPLPHDRCGTKHDGLSDAQHHAVRQSACVRGGDAVARARLQLSTSAWRVSLGRWRASLLAMVLFPVGSHLVIDISKAVCARAAHAAGRLRVRRGDTCGHVPSRAITSTVRKARLGHAERCAECRSACALRCGSRQAARRDPRL